jgi:hypothetical protein
LSEKIGELREGECCLRAAVVGIRVEVEDTEAGGGELPMGGLLSEDSSCTERDKYHAI